MTELNQNERILAALREARLKLEAVDRERREPIAIIGMAGRFPGAEDTRALWQLLQEGRSGVRLLSEQELEQSGVSKELYSQPDYVPAWASFDEPAAFDAGFFGYSPREATLLDPQHRVFLECAWHALEHAGYDADQFDGDIGVFAGAALNSYLINLHNQPDLRHNTDKVQAVVSNVMGLMPTRVSYHLNLTGPSIGIQTGCSTSLVAVHQACRSLLANECQMALAGGVTISEAKPSGYLYQEGSIASPDGVTRSFDAAGTGTVFGNGVGIVVLKRLSQAQADGDRILALIRGSAVNNDGSDKVGLIAPSVSGQAQVIETALKQAAVEPESLQYIEAHATGTAMGDPIEVTALNRVFKSSTCALGSVKSNLGHLDAAAGVTGLIKTVLSLQHQAIPASLNYQTPNPNIRFDDSPFSVNTRLTPWPKRSNDNVPRRAGVSSFGMGGTNAHAILEEAPERLQENPSDNKALKARQWQILPVSAQCETALSTLCEQVKERVQAEVADAAFTLQQGRKALARRQCLVVRESDAHQIVTLPDDSTPNNAEVVFLFPGQGSQRLDMARDLYEQEPVFREHLDQCADLLLQLTNPVDLKALIFTDEQSSRNSDARTRLQQTANTQPALFAVEYSLAKLIMYWGIEPARMIGHSVGEYVAACLSGVMDLADAVMLVSERGRLMQSCEPGSMLAVMMPASDLQGWLHQNGFSEGWDIAAVNAPQQTVLSGSEPLVADVLSKLEEQGKAARLLQTSHAFHSASMNPILESFRSIVRDVDLQAPSMDLYSNVTGKLLTDNQATSKDYWVSQLRESVRFNDCVQHAMTNADTPILFLEVGPGDALCRTLPRDQISVPCLSAKGRAEGEDDLALTMALARLWRSGVSIDWKSYHQDRPGRRAELPLYPFQREVYWVDATQNSNQVSKTSVSTSVQSATNCYKPGWAIADFDSPDFGTEVMPCGRIQQLGGPDALFTAFNPSNVELPDQIVLWADAIVNQQDSETDISVQLCTALLSLRDQLGSISACLEGHKPNKPLLLTLVTQGAYALSANEKTSPIQRGLNGFWQVVGQEWPGTLTRQIDVESNVPLVQQKASLMDAILNIPNEDSLPFHNLMLIRNDLIWHRQYKPVALSSSNSQMSNGLVAGGTYVIAGDLANGLGMMFVYSLHRHLQAKLILCADDGIPQEAAWESWLATHGPRHPVSVMIRTLQGLKQEGLQYEWTSPQQLQFRGPVEGVFLVDAMGDQSACELNSLDQSTVEKIVGQRLVNLDRLAQAVRTGTLKTGFVAVQSSLSAIAGGSGFSVYAASSAALDGLVAGYGNELPDTRWISINWDAVETDVMAFRQQQSLNTGSELLDNALNMDLAWDAMHDILTSTPSRQWVITPSDLTARLQQAFNRQDVTGQTATDQTGNGGRPNLATPYEAPGTETERMVVAAMGELLGIRQVGINDDFFDLGGHSLLAIQAVTRLRKEFNVELPMRALLFEARTPAGIAAVIDKSRPTAVDLEENLQQSNDISEDELDALFSAVEELTPEEAAKQLAQET